MRSTSSSRAVRNRTGTELRARISRQTSNPSWAPGSPTSRITIQGSSCVKTSSPFSPSLGQQHPEPLPAQVEVHQIGDVRVVLDDHDRPVLGTHGSSLASPAPGNAGMRGSLTEPSRLPNMPITRCAHHGLTTDPRIGGPEERSTHVDRAHASDPPRHHRPGVRRPLRLVPAAAGAATDPGPRRQQRPQRRTRHPRRHQVQGDHGHHRPRAYAQLGHRQGQRSQGSRIRAAHAGRLPGHRHHTAAAARSEDPGRRDGQAGGRRTSPPSSAPTASTCSSCRPPGSPPTPTVSRAPPSPRSPPTRRRPRGW